MAKGKKGAVRTKRREKKNVPDGIIFIYSTFNNTLITISDKLGNVVSWSSA
ncbi:30S ribosomal protein S11, partial [Desulfobulbus sp. US5]|nr:30S ribosomal protein S11 [Desulfobulbus sp. US5]